MRLQRICTIALAGMLATACFGQEYLEVTAIKARHEKRAELDAVMKKIAEANRKNNGDNWIVSDTIFGEWDTLYISSPRAGFADIEKSQATFLGAMLKAFGPTFETVFRDFNNCVSEVRSEVRIRRTDLSSITAGDMASILKTVGGAKYIRATRVRVRPGKGGLYEEAIKSFKTAWDRNQMTRIVSQTVVGGVGQTYYISQLAGSMAEFDKNIPARQLLGDTAYANYTRITGEAVLATDSYIARYSPEMSNPPAAVVQAAPDFWNPKPAATPEPDKKKGKKK
jgi:hypothetical protein